MLVTIIGAKPYRVRTQENLQEYRDTVAGMYVLDNGLVAAEREELEKKGVRRDFLSYLLRNDFLKQVP